jgi:Holliday junction resolvase RusA-like endonuclease
MPELRFAIPGEPVSQGSMRAMRTKRGGVVIFHAGAEKLSDYRERVALAVAKIWEGRPPLDARVVVGADLFLVRPLDHFQGRNPNRPLRPSAESLAPRRPDLDKAGRALLDALVTARLLSDDSQVVELHLTKRYGAAPHTGVYLRWPA